MSDRNRTTETEKVVKHVLKTASKYDSIGKAEFEVILHKVKRQVRRNTGIESDTISQTTKKVLEDMPNEYGQLSEADRTWEALIAYLYHKYLRELGVLE